MNTKELKKKFLEFFKSRGHIIIKSSPLIPENDPTVLFTTAGMHPIVPFLLGTSHPSGKRLADVQKCIRTGDIDSVGDDTHLTFFEMLGNWSLGDYFKKDAIEFSFEFLTKELKLPVKKLAITCFSGDKDAPKDEEAAGIWMKLGIPKERIAFLPKENNWWGPAGETGPCGPCTEMFYWISDEEPPKNFDPDDNKWVEIWNDVFMQYTKTKDGKYELSKQKNVDTGMGTERVAAILQEKKNVYETEVFLPIIREIKTLSKNHNETYTRIIADHLKAASFILGDEIGVRPSNLGQGYVLRRLIRKSIRLGKLLGIKDKFTSKIARIVVEIYKEDYPELLLNKDVIVNELDEEEERFTKTLETGLKQFDKLSKEKNISGKDAFILFSSYGFPFEMTEELAKEKNIRINKKEFDEEFKKHQELSRTATEGIFKGGLADASYENAKLHTATHLLHAALRKILGEKVQQKGSNITPERLRFDFSFDRKLADSEIKKAEDMVNEKIKEKLPVIKKISSPEEAKAEGALAFFGHKYGDKISIYDIKGFSKEICMGPHVENTKELGKFKIIKEEAVAAGVRRIKAILE